ncbi:MAG: dehalogenase [Dehalogenimonas sp.]|uniref:Dehalogenase n=1 Tax=Candidatus Dehalogenimonas loeffleri TaxID=3127115 RepID=A0ABZ2J8T8_9CHLR|nr:dehalogenase [Dehalogenimonas sp.]
MEWIIFAFIFGAALVWFIVWLRNKQLSLKWYEWLVGGLGILLLIGSVQHYLGSLREDYATPGAIGALIFGLPALILLALAWQLVVRRTKTQPN